VHISVVHGPNLNLLGSRQVELYGRVTLAQINSDLEQIASDLGLTIHCEQHNGEGALVDAVQAAATSDALLINPAAYTHTSVALRDAILAVAIPTWAVHLTEPNSRETFRRVDLISDVVIGRTAGLGAASYSEALRKLVSWLRMRAKKPHL
jgi:3-dehydroquinate dehydratase-2